MPRYIDEEHLWTRLRSICDLNCPYSEKQRDIMCSACLLGNAFETIDSEKTVEAVEVVRCKDCKYYNGEYKYCVNDIFAKPNGYCSYGKREEDDQGNGY